MGKILRGEGHWKERKVRSEPKCGYPEKFVETVKKEKKINIIEVGFLTEVS